ncbi:putative bifunctional diguanylate cyclase/phosphodiesterase [Longimicrobium sp.]|uniref:putative bifunctional diguanylate cyclase/phosphodiesterase n=1 Tax=Longimicrobium sp. TaxID=2029185 RepID=UPI002C57300C|nr:EAL domain-containing protein [Longimicrobium sp.]HSU13079.1 EAL domain-containing protein [Longimicrobium sp.]
MSVHADFSAGPIGPAPGVTADTGGHPVECAPEGLDYRGVFLGSPHAVLAVDSWGRVTAANPACRDLWHAPAGSLIDAPFLSLVWPEDRARAQEALDAARAGAAPELPLALARRDGNRQETTARLVLVDGCTLLYLCAVPELAAGLAADAVLREIVDGSAELFFYHQDGAGVLEYVSPGVSRVLGYAPEELVGTPLERLAEPCPAGPAPEAAAENGASHIHAFRDRRGRTVYLELIEAPVRRGSGDAGVQGLARDVTRQKRLEEQLVHEALHDPLTGLPNRALFLDRLQHTARASTRDPGALFAILLVDVDDFKHINDRMGHELGDRVLVDIAGRLQQCVRPGDTVCRLGGDEFTVLLHSIGDPGDATRVADRIRAELVSPFRLSPHELFVTTSIGIAVSGTAGNDLAELMRQADTALYRAKAGGKARYEVFDREMHESTLARLQLESDLRTAVRGGGLSLQYQPVISMETGLISSFEALVRWRHPSRGTLEARHFVPVAEDTGLVGAIDRWVLREACRQLHAWQRQFGERSPRVSVNVSARELLSHDGVEHLRKVLAETGAEPSLLRLEVPESVLADSRVEEVLRALRGLGVVVQVDQYGTVGSTPASLRRLEVEAVKVHRSVLQQEAGDPEVLRAIVSLAHALHLVVVVGGVETDEQMTRLRSMGCDFVQGFFLCGPVDAEEARRMMVTEKHAA